MTTKVALVWMAVTLISGGTGLMIGLLTAPASGRESRRMWLRRGQEELEAQKRKGRRALADAADQAKNFVEDKLDRGKEAVSTLVVGG